MARSGVADMVTMVTRGDMGWPGKAESRIGWVTGMLTPHMRSLYHGLSTRL